MDLSKHLNYKIDFLIKNISSYLLKIFILGLILPDVLISDNIGLELLDERNAC